MGNLNAMELLQGALGGAQGLLSLGNMPDAPNPWGENEALAAGSVQRNYGPAHQGIRRFTGGPGPGVAQRNRFLAPDSISLNNLASQAISDEYARAEGQATDNQRILEALARFSSDRTSRTGQMGEDREGMAGAITRGRSEIAGERRGLQRAGREASQLARTSVESTLGLLNEFHESSQEMLSEVRTMGAAVLSDLRDTTAARMAVASESVHLQTKQQMSDTRAEMMAQGVPVAQISNQVAQVASKGAQMLDGILLESAVTDQQMRLETQLNVAGMVTSTLTNVLGAREGVTKTAMGEISGTLSDLAARKVQLAEMNTALGEAGRSWESDVRGNMGNLSAEMARMELMGQGAEMEVLRTLQTPIVELGDILTSTWQSRIDLREYQHQIDMGNWAQADAVANRMFNSWQNTLSSSAERNAARSQADADRAAQREGFAWDFAGDTVGGVAQVGAAVL